MAIYSFNGNHLKHMLRGATALLNRSKNEINSLNVFPVPDGDTGTNMYETLVCAVREAEAAETESISLIARAAAKGCLLGARGNSGVILSQFLSGFASALTDMDTADVADITLALKEGAEVAYQAVMNPVEGTILTVVRKSAEGAETAMTRSKDLLRLMLTVFKEAFTSLKETPDHLPALKKAGVVDAGGKGFVVILEGMLDTLKKDSPAAKELLPASMEKISPALQADVSTVESPFSFTYCTEFLIKGSPSAAKIKTELISYGDCLIVVGEENILKVHIHTNHPGTVLENCLKYGTLHDIRINNMIDQFNETNDGLVNLETSLPRQQDQTERAISIVAVVSGPGLAKIYKNLGADIIVSGGQTFNPSTGDILKAIEKAPSNQVIVLPNNKNTILSAGQAGKASSKEVLVIPSVSIPQGIAALLSLSPEDRLETAGQKMKAALDTVLSGEVTHAVRDTIHNGLFIHQGDVIGIWEGNLMTAGTSLETVLDSLLADEIKEDERLITLYYGESVTEEKARKIIKELSAKHPQQEFDLQYGGQPVYDLIISVE